MDDVVTRAGLRARGYSGHFLTAAVRDGRIRRLRLGVYASNDVDEPTAIAVALGGRLGCVSELRRRGVWVREPDAVHVQLRRSTARIVGGPGCILHWSRSPWLGTASIGRVHILDALACAVRCLPRLESVAALDSALNRRLVTMTDLEAAVGGSRRGRLLLALLDPAAQSGLESIVRVALRDLGLDVRSQVRFLSIGIVDLVIEGRVVVELDGAEFHGGEVSAQDRRRDARHAAAGRIPLRFRYAQVVHDLPSVLAAVVGAVQTHRDVQGAGRKAARARRRLESR